MSYKMLEERGRLEERLHEVEEKFERQMRKRGFEPAQAELVALPGPLAKLYAEREELRSDLEKLKADLPEQDVSRSQLYERNREN